MRGLRTPVGRAVAALVAVGALVIVAERCRWFGRLLATGTPERLWIWAPVSPRDVVPRAFFAMRDFDLETRPSSATLEILGDAEYLAWLNGHQVGSGRYREGHPIDAYEVGDLLLAGRNRWLVELRSAIGAGGMTGRIVDGAGRTLVETDGSWGIYEGGWRALYGGDEPPPAPWARVLGRAPIGRWGLPLVAPALPERAEFVTEVGGVYATRYRRAVPGSEWRRPKRVSLRHRLPDPVRIDFGESRIGFLHLDLAPESSRTALVRFDPGDVGSRGWIPDEIVIAVPHNGFWQDVEPRRFRTVEIVGLDGLFAARVVPIDPEAALSLGTAAPPTDLAGRAIEPPRIPIVDQIWKSVGLAEAPKPDDSD